MPHPLSRQHLFPKEQGMRIRSIVLAACTAALIAPAASQAASISQDSGAIVYHGEGSQGLWMSVSTNEDWDSGIRYLHFSDSGAAVSIDTDLCHKSTVGGIDCDLDPHRPVRIEGSSTKDDLQVSQGMDRVP